MYPYPQILNMYIKIIARMTDDERFKLTSISRHLGISFRDISKVSIWNSLYDISWSRTTSSLVNSFPPQLKCSTQSVFLPTRITTACPKGMRSPYKYHLKISAYIAHRFTKITAQLKSCSLKRHAFEILHTPPQ